MPETREPAPTLSLGDSVELCRCGSASSRGKGGVMSTLEPSNVPAVVSADFDSLKLRQAVAGYLAGFRESTRKAYGLDLRQWLGWCRTHDLVVFQARRAHIELLPAGSNAVGLDRNELGMFLVQAGLSGGRIMLWRVCLLSTD